MVALPDLREALSLPPSSLSLPEKAASLCRLYRLSVSVDLLLRLLFGIDKAVLGVVICFCVLGVIACGITAVCLC